MSSVIDAERPALPRAVIFDWDNTLVDSWAAIEESINFVRARYGLPVWDRAGILANCTRSARESFPDWFGDKWQDAWADYYAYFDKVRTRMGINPANGAADLLDWLKQNNIPALVVSNKSGDYLRQEAELLGWTKYFVSIVGAHDAERDKPDRAHADHALRLGKVEGGRDVWFVGDSEADMLCAKNAECTPVFIGTEVDAAKHGALFHAVDCAALLGLLCDRRRAIA